MAGHVPFYAGVRPGRRSRPRRRICACRRCSRPRAGHRRRPSARHRDGAGQSRRSAAFTRFDGNLAGLDLPTTRRAPHFGDPPAGLGRVPARLFDAVSARRGGGGGRRAEAGDGSAGRGQPIHESWTASWRTDRRRPVRPWSGPERARLLEIAEDVFAEYGERGATGRAMFWRRDRARILADLERFAALDDGRPLCTELGFADVAYPLPGGRSVRLRGPSTGSTTPDRARHGHRLQDGQHPRLRGARRRDPHQGGSHLQLAMYGRRCNSAGPGGRRHRLLVRHGEGKVRPDRLPLTPEIQAVVGEAVATIVDGIGPGISPPAGVRPVFRVGRLLVLRAGWAEHRRGPPGLGAQAIRPVLADYVGLVEPEALDDDA